LIAKLEALFRTRTAQDWETLMEAAGVPLAICRTTREWTELPEAKASGAIVELPDSTLGMVRQPGMQINLSETPGGIAGGAPRPDHHRAEILAELRTLSPRSMPLSPKPDRRAPLAGLRVVDLGTVLVGPACGRTLAEFGADVIKVDDPKGLGPGIDVGRGKRSLLLDLRPAEGREVLDRLIDSSDIVLQNFRYGVAEKMGIGYEQLRKKKPGLIYIAYSLYGRKSPWAGRPGYDNQAQAATGMMDRFGDGRPAIEALTVNDYGTALIGSFGVALAIYHQNRLKSEGRPAIGQLVDSALVCTASMLQAPFLCDHPGAIHDEPRGQSALGSGALHRHYRAADGWMFLAAHPAQLGSMGAVEGLSGITSQKPETLQAFLEERLSSASVSEWSKRFAAIDVAVHATLTIAQVMSLTYSRSRNLLLERPHPDGGMVTTIGPIPRLSHTPVQAGRPLRPSLDAEEVLTEIGLADRIASLLQDGIIAIRPPKK
jgi:crotonobetainyl-CoA:carnitine CoA-transferase CaiB-like acyl-CoA transferase